MTSLTCFSAERERASKEDSMHIRCSSYSAFPKEGFFSFLTRRLCWSYGSFHFLKRDCVTDAVPLYQYTRWNRCSFGRPRKDDGLSQPPGVLIQWPTGLELRTLGSQATTLTTEPTPGLLRLFLHTSYPYFRVWSFIKQDGSSAILD